MRRRILEFIITCQRERNFPPTIREIGDHVGLKSPATVANHIEVLKRAGYIEKNPQQPRTLTVRLDVENPAPDQKIRYIPFVGDVAAGTGVLAQEIAHELMSIPEHPPDGATVSCWRSAVSR
jgi:repressor LexA